jgi:hypothetical protein
MDAGKRANIHLKGDTDSRSSSTSLRGDGYRAPARFGSWGESGQLGFYLLPEPESGTLMLGIYCTSVQSRKDSRLQKKKKEKKKKNTERKANVSGALFGTSQP